MPFLIKLPAKKVIHNNLNNIVLKSLNEAIKKHGLATPAPDGAVSSDLTVKDVKQRAGFEGRVIRLLERITNESLGGYESLLCEFSLLKFDPAAQILREAYIQYLNELILKEKCKYIDTEKDEISSVYILVREILMRLVSIALCVDSELERDGDKILSVIQDFTQGVVQAGVLKKANELSSFEKAFASSHFEWINCLQEMVEVVKTIHSNVIAISQTLTHLDILKDALMRHLIAQFNPNIQEEGALTKNWLKKTLANCENNFIKKCLAMLPNNSNRSLHVNRDNQVKLSELAELGIVSQDQAEREEQVLTLLHTVKIDEKRINKIERLYAALNQTELFILALAQIDQLITVGGWVPIMTNSINLIEFSNLIEKHVSNCRELTLFVPNDSLFETKVGKELIKYQIEMFHLPKIIFKDAQALKKLQDNEVVARLKQTVASSIVYLKGLEEKLNCKILTNNIDGSQVVQKLSVPKSNTELLLKNSTILKITSSLKPNPKKLMEEINAHVEGGRYEVAIEKLNVLIDDLGKNSIEHLYYRAQLRTACSYYAEALLDVNLILNIDKNNQEASELLEQLMFKVNPTLT